MAQLRSVSSSVNLKDEQYLTLSTPRQDYGLLARLLFSGMDVVYGRPRSIRKFKVLEVIARVPYQAWEQVAYVALTHVHKKPGFARRIFEFVRESRAQQDNEQWHLLLLQEMIQKKSIREGFIRFGVLPQLIAFAYYHISWILYVIKPEWSYKLNADFEDHAEHEYMEYVSENPSLEKEPFESDFKRDYGDFASVADLFRQIAVDERHHKMESLARINHARFA